MLTDTERLARAEEEVDRTRLQELGAVADRAVEHQGRLATPVLALGSDQGSISDKATPLRAFAEDVIGGSIANCGHFLPEEQPEAIARELLDVFGHT